MFDVGRTNNQRMAAPHPVLPVGCPYLLILTPDPADPHYWFVLPSTTFWPPTGFPQVPREVHAPGCPPALGGAAGGAARHRQDAVGTRGGR